MPNPNEKPPLPASVMQTMNELLDRFCPAEHGFLRCARARGHEGPHYDVIQAVDWTTATGGEGGGDG